MATEVSEAKMPGTPKPWMNRVMMLMLGTPGLRRLVGRLFGVITVTGARSGRRYRTPIQYVAIDGRYLVLSQRHRRWWRNIGTVPRVELLVAGRDLVGTATIVNPDEERDRARALMTSVLQASPSTARFYGLDTGPDGTVPIPALDGLLDRVVLIDIKVTAP